MSEGCTHAMSAFLCLCVWEQVGKTIAELEQKKKEAVVAEDYDTAMDLKVRIPFPFF